MIFEKYHALGNDYLVFDPARMIILLPHLKPFGFVTGILALGRMVFLLDHFLAIKLILDYAF